MDKESYTIFSTLLCIHCGEDISEKVLEGALKAFMETDFILSNRELREKMMATPFCKETYESLKKY